MGKNKFISSAMAAEMLGFTQHYISELCLKGKIKAEKIGHQWLFSVNAIKHLKRQRKKKEPIEHGSISE